MNILHSPAATIIHFFVFFLAGPRVSTARKRKRQRMKSRQISKKCLASKDASDPKLIELPANLMVLSNQHEQGKSTLFLK